MKERALNFAIRVMGGEEAKATMQGVATAARSTLGPLGEASKAAAQHEAAVMRAAGAADALGAAQAGVARDLAAAKAALKAGTMDQAAYEAAVLKAKQATTLARAEYRATTAELERTSAALVAARGAAAGIAPPLQQGARSSGEARAGMQQLGFQINDVAVQYAAGTSAMQIFVQQSGQVIQSVGMMTGGQGRLAAMLTGPWGLAITAGISLLGLFATKMMASSKETDKNAKSQQTLAEKLDRTKNSYDEVVAAVREYNGQAAKTREVTLQNAAAAATAAAANIKEALSIREKLAAQLAAANATVRGSAGQGFGGAASMNLGRAAAVEAQIRTNDEALRKLAKDAEQTVVNVADEMAKLATDPQYAIEQRFTRLKNEARASIKDVKELTKRLADLTRQEKAALEAIKPERGSGNRDSGSLADFSMPVSGGKITSRFGVDRGSHMHGGIDIAAPAGTKVAAPQVGVVTAVGFSKTLGKYVVIDHGAGTTTRFGHLSDNSMVSKGDRVDQGQTIGLVGSTGRSTGPHLHYETRRGGKPVDPMKGRFPIDELRTGQAAARDAERDREEAIRREKAREQLFAALDMELLDAKRAGITDAEQLAGFARQRIEAEAGKAAADIDSRVKLGELTQAEGELAQIKIDAVKQARLDQVKADEQRRLRAEALQAEMVTIDLQRDSLSLLGSMATTQAERREIQLALLALDEREERARLRAVLASETDAAKREEAAKRLAALDANSGLRRQAVLDQTAGPGERFAREINLNPAQMNEAIEQIKVDGLKSLNDGLVDAIVNFRSLADVAQSVLKGITTDLVNLSVQKYITAPLADLLGLGAKDGAKAAASVLGGGGAGGSSDAIVDQLGLGGVDVASVKAAAAITAMTIAAQQFASSMAMSSSGGGGGGIGGILGAVAGLIAPGVSGATVARLTPDVTATIAANPMLFASGTDRVPTGKPFWVGENGRELMERTPDGGLRVHSNQQVRRMAESGGGGAPIIQTFNIPERADPRRTASAISRATQSGMARASRKGLATTGGYR